MELALCRTCGLLQLRHTVPGELMYRNYWYRFGTNQSMRNALADIAHEAEILIHLCGGDSVLDIGCNDGTLLASCTMQGIYRIGFDPAQNLAPFSQKARDKGAVGFLDAVKHSIMLLALGLVLWPALAGAQNYSTGPYPAAWSVTVDQSPSPQKQVARVDYNGKSTLNVSGDRPILNAQNFPGATADAKITACIQALPATGGTCDARGLTGAQTISSTVNITKPVTLLLGAATYNYGSVNPAISVSSDGVRISGLGRGLTTITTSTPYVVAIQSGNPIALGNNNVIIQGITFAGPSPVSWDVRGTGAIALFGASGWLIRDCEFTGWADVAIALGQAILSGTLYGTNHVTVANNFIHDNEGEGVLVYVTGPFDGYNIISSNQIWNNGLSGVDINGQHNTVVGNTVSQNGTQSKNGDSSNLQITGNNANYNLIEGNQISFGNQWNLTVWGSYNRIVNNEISYTTNKIGDFGTGLELCNAGSGTVTNGNIIQGNTIIGNAARGIEVTPAGARGTCDKNIITSNLVLNNSGVGIFVLYGANPVTQTTITNNTVLGNGGGGQIIDAVGAGDTNIVAFNRSTASNADLVVESRSPLLFSGRLGRYNGITLSNNGLASEVASAAVNAQHADVSSTTLYTAPGSPLYAFYKVSVYIVVTQAASTSATLPRAQVTFCDGFTGFCGNTTLLTTTSTGNSPGSTYAYGSAILSLRGGQPISYSTSGYASSGTTPMQFAAFWVLEAL